MKPPRVYAIDGVVPVVDPSAYVHPSAVLIGDVIVGPGCYVGPCASLRGDFGRLILMAGVNVQDTCVIHSFPDHDTVINENGHIGHGAVLHCCTIGRNALVGMNAVVMDNAVVGENAFVAACSFVKAGMQVPPATLVAGTPAKVVRPLTEQEMAWKVQGTGIYQNLTRRCLATMVETDALAAVEADRKRIVMPEIVPLSEQKQRS
ncbi:transferase hexapeptide repeat family protein [Aromatoleum aromaticum]|uniref:Bacterial transferase n=1 Tax=Aromatoleum aromaticum (strain DSM 19018 / LMG 30748 / EbN1) TaxID=76114 RepID=Q5P6A7_AROAE|nr:transferase hexapeptide repeat family protein [Aromatoleum aromaticum]NMG54896.1 phenylacetic acid degradation protein PaaY [Aromatoleum aromaticum]CAI07154.1 Bacterial transferase [Aromatoleum aromaticum EbN1]